MHILREQCLFFTNNIDVPHGDILARIKLLYSKNCNCWFSSFSFVGAIRYGGMNICKVLGDKSIPDSISHIGGNPGKFSGNTSENSFTTGIFSKLSALSFVSLAITKRLVQPFYSNL